MGGIPVDPAFVLALFNQANSQSPLLPSMPLTAIDRVSQLDSEKGVWIIVVGPSPTVVEFGSIRSGPVVLYLYRSWHRVSNNFHYFEAVTL